MALSPITPYIVYGLTKDLGLVYNELMEKAQTEWVLFLDHDLFICNPLWYRLSCHAIKECKNAGLISAVCNRLAADRYAQVLPPPIDSNNLEDHVRHARSLQQQFGTRCIRVGPEAAPFSGFFILTSKTVWRAVGGFKTTGFLGVDDNYSGKILAHGYHRYVIQGLYFYHMRQAKKHLMGDWPCLDV